MGIPGARFCALDRSNLDHKHTTGWEDAQVAQYFCDGVEAGTLLAGKIDQCEICGQTICLIWNVYIEVQR